MSVPVAVMKILGICSFCIFIDYLMINLNLVQLDIVFVSGDEAAKSCIETLT